MNYTTLGQLTQIRWQLTNISQQIRSPDYQSKAAVAFAKDENYDQALKLANQIQNSDYKAAALSAIAQAIGKLNQPEKAGALLDKAIAYANQIQDSGIKARALSAIAQAAANLKNWGQALKVTQQCPSDDCKVESLARVLKVHAEQQHPELKEE